MIESGTPLDAAVDAPPIRKLCLLAVTGKKMQQRRGESNNGYCSI